MTELITKNEQTLANIKDLTNTVTIGREHLTALRAELRALNKAGAAAEFRKERLKQAQDEAEMVLDAEVKLGEIFCQLPKASGARTDLQPSNPGVTRLNTKEEAILEAGFSKKQAYQFESLVEYPEFVEQAKAEARQNDDIVTRSAVLSLIDKTKNKPHVANNNGNNEWYTPEDYIDLARKVMTEIDLDPASNEIANKVVKAKKIYTAQDNGLIHDWQGKVWMNPPYAAELIGQFVNKFVDEYNSGNITEGIVLVNNATDTGWFKTLLTYTSAVCFPTGRVRFYAPDGEIGAPLQGQALLYFGKDPKAFGKAFEEKGRCLYPE